MFIRHLNIKTRLKLVLTSLITVLSCTGLNAQTLVTQPMTGTPAAGEYYNNSSIVLSPDFNFKASAGQSLHLYIINASSQPLATNPSGDQNYILTSVPRIPDFNPSLSSYTNSDVMQSVAYFDGLGRPSQTVQVKGSPQGKDIVVPVVYDQFGRAAARYLPYAAVTTADGSYKTDALQSGGGLFNFYNPPGTATTVTQLPGGIPHTNTPYAVTGFEPSNLNRIVEQGAPGDPWQLSATGLSGSGHTIKTAYGTNIANEVILWAVNGAGATGTSFYTAGQLNTIVTTDENGNSSIEYKDKTGKVVCKKVQSGINPVTYLSTSYVYDSFDNLAYVIPPIPVAQYPSSFTESDAVFLNYIYGYHYDQRQRLVEKQVPGKKWEYLVYNALDQVVATQDGNQRNSNQWTFTKYDALGRVVSSGTWRSGTVMLRSDLQTLINGLNSPLWESRPTGGYPTNVAWPTGGFSGQLVINYYDDYTFPDAQYATPASASTHTNGLLTGTKTYVLNSVAVLYTQFYYDDLGRNTTTLKEHYLGGTTGQPNPSNYDEITNTYDFSNNLTSTVRHHYTTASTTVASLIVTNAFTYDHMNRRKQNLGSVAAGNQPAPNLTLISQLDYNEIGQLMTKHLHGETGAAPFLQNLNYSYNERGWLNSAGDSNNLFSFNLKYNNPDPGITPQFNGNITGMQYAASKSGNKSFTYRYDPMNRLTDAVSTNNLLNEQISYDQLGNISTLVRTGNNAVNLIYRYLDNNNIPGNQLNRVTNNGTSFRNYGYDANGNAISDGISKSIGYNLFNLPQSVIQGDNTVATYIYDGLGIKLRNIGSDGSWDYIDGIVYNNGAVQFVQTEEGRAIPNGNSYHYEYNLKDHLGNVRVSFDRDPSTGAAREIQEDEYYAFGLRNPGGYNLASNNRYLYNGKELQTDLSNQYDYGARFYDPVIGRWNVVDPLLEINRKYSPYAYGNNNPVRFVDPDGMSVVETAFATTYTGSDIAGQAQKYGIGKSFDKTENSGDSNNNQNNQTGRQYIANSAASSTEINAMEGGGPPGKKKSQLPNKRVTGSGYNISAGAGLFMQGLEVSVGAFGVGPWKYPYFSYAYPKNPLYVNASVSAQLLMGYSDQGKFNLSGSGRTYAVGVGDFSGSYSVDNPQHPSYRVIGVGPGLGIKYSGGYTETNTFVLPFPIFVHMVGLILPNFH